MPRLREIAALLGVEAPDVDPEISGIGSLDSAGPGEISFLSSDAHLKQFVATRAAAVLVGKRIKLPPEPAVPILLVDDAELALAKVLDLFAPAIPHPPVGVDPSARIADSASVDPSARIGPFVSVGERSRIGANTALHPGVQIGQDVTVGADCQLFANVVVRERITIGARVIIHAGSVLGSDGFGYRWDGRQHAKIAQIGTVMVEDDVEIGSCVCVDRAKFAVTRIGRGTKIDNLVQVAHNVQIGEHCLLAGQSGTAGSVILDEGVVLGGQCAIRDHVRLGEGVMVAACSGVAEDVPAKTVVAGLPAVPHRQWLRDQAAMRRLPEMLAQLRALEKEVEGLKQAVSRPE